MKNKFFLILLVVMCFGFVPKNIFALQVYNNNVNIDYRFFVDEDEIDAGNLKFKLYDKSGTLNFESKYDSSTKQYYFEYDELEYPKNEFFTDDFYDYSYNYNNYRIHGYYNYDYDSYYDYWTYHENSYREYFPYKDLAISVNGINTLINSDHIQGFCKYYWYKTNICNTYFYLPLIIETNTSTVSFKKIVFASVNFIFINHEDSSSTSSYVKVFLVNNTASWKSDYVSLKDSLLNNIDFMRKTMLDYSDELWEELNNGPIASSEIYSNNKVSANYKYVNQSIGTGEQNVPEETLDDYANSLPVLSFRKTNNTNGTNNGGEDNNKNDDNKIVDIVTNPKTGNNGVVILVISMIIIIGSSFILIKRKNN